MYMLCIFIFYYLLFVPSSRGVLPPCVISKPQEWGGHGPHWAAAPWGVGEYLYQQMHTHTHTHTHIYIYLYYNIKFYYKCSMLRCFCTIFRELWFCVCYCVLPCNNLLLYAILIFCNFSKRNTRTLWSHLQRVLVLRLLKLQNIKIA